MSKPLNLFHTSMVAHASDILGIIKAHIPMTGDFIPLYKGDFDTLKCYKNGIVTSIGNRFTSTDGTIDCIQEHQNWDVFYNAASARIIVQKDTEFLLITEAGIEVFYTTDEDFTSWGLNDIGLVLFSDVNNKLTMVEFATTKQYVLFSSDDTFRWEAGWQGAIIESKGEILYSYNEHSTTLVRKDNDKYTDWLINIGSSCPTIVLVTEECLVYIRHQTNGQEIHYKLTNDYDDFWPCQDGVLLYYKAIWQYLPYNGSGTELPFMASKDTEITPHPSGVIMSNKQLATLIFL